MASVSVGCTPASSLGPVRAPQAQRWFERAQASFQTVDLEDADDAVREALRHAQDEEVRLLAANIALAKLDYDRTIELTEGMTGASSLGLRARAQWYDGQVQAAGTTIDALLQDPEVRDPWAKAISQLAHRGVGREPYRVVGSIVVPIDMPRVASSAMIVPVEIDGEQALALISTGTTEVVLDSAQRREPSWISLRFGDRIEYQDVPAITQDLSGISRRVGAPIKAMLGVNFLRHANPTIDLMAHQFVVRQFDPPRPPEATDLPVYYMRGGAMVVRSTLQTNSTAPAALMIDTSAPLLLALDSDGFKKAGLDAATLAAPGRSGVKQGVVPMIRLGAFDIPQVPAVLNSEVASLEQAMGIDLDGLLGSDLLGAFRLTLGQGGRVLYLEEDMMSGVPQPGQPEAPRQPSAPSLQLPQPGVPAPNAPQPID